MLCISEHNSEDNESSQDTEYHSKSGIKSESGDYTFSNVDQRDSILNVQFPMSYKFPKPYMTLQEVIDNALDQEWNPNIYKDPDEALHYIINHFNIKIVSHSIQRFPEYSFEQVYHSTYITTSQYEKLQWLIDLSARNLHNRHALAQQRLALEQCVRYHLTSDTLPPYLLQCLL